MKFIIHAQNQRALDYGASCAFDFKQSGHSLCGYADPWFFASCKRNKESITIYVVAKV